MTRMRTATGALAEIKASDPGTEITIRAIRTLINTAKVPVVNIGTKKLVDVDKLLDYFAAGDTVQEVAPVGKIRKVV